MPTLEYFFDFLSPYAYLSHFRLPQLAARYGYRVDYRPIDLKAAKLATGNTAPSTAQMPAKLRYALADLERWAGRYDVPLAAPSGPPQSERANKGTFYAIERDQAGDYVDRLWRATFGAGEDMNSDELLSRIAGEMGWAPEDFLAFVGSDEAAQAYATGNRDAQARGVFGVPTVIAGGEMWWGNDRLDMIEEYLAANPAA